MGLPYRTSSHDVPRRHNLRPSMTSHKKCSLFPCFEGELLLHEMVVKLSTTADGISEHASIFRTVWGGQRSMRGAIKLCADAMYVYIYIYSV